MRTRFVASVRTYRCPPTRYSVVRTVSGSRLVFFGGS
jgi:hypothetical protein